MSSSSSMVEQLDYMEEWRTGDIINQSLIFSFCSITNSSLESLLYLPGGSDQGDTGGPAEAEVSPHVPQGLRSGVVADEDHLPCLQD